MLFSSTAIALYGYDQGMMSLINTNYDYLETMGIAEEDPQVGFIVSVYYLGKSLPSRPSWHNTEKYPTDYVILPPFDREHLHLITSSMY